MDVFLLPTIFLITANFLELPRCHSHPDTHLEGRVLDVPWGTSQGCLMVLLVLPSSGSQILPVALQGTGNFLISSRGLGHTTLQLGLHLRTQERVEFHDSPDRPGSFGC